MVQAALDLSEMASDGLVDIDRTGRPGDLIFDGVV